MKTILCILAVLVLTANAADAYVRRAVGGGYVVRGAGAYSGALCWRLLRSRLLWSSGGAWCGATRHNRMGLESALLRRRLLRTGRPTLLTRYRVREV